jgi:hypothetical protein
VTTEFSGLIPQPRVLEPLPGYTDTTKWASPEQLREDAQLDPALRNPEAFILHLSEQRNTLHLGSDRALPYAWDTLQAWREGTPQKTPAVHLEDHPEFPVRGFMLDISRCKVPTRASLTRWVEWLSAFRYNQLQLYTEHTFAYRDHRTVWAEASPMTPEDIQWLQHLCRERGIELVPNQNTFGHFERWLEHPAYAALAESPHGFVTPWGDQRSVGSVLKPDADSLQLVTGLLDELLPLFDSPSVNIGCDETFELGKGASRERCTREGVGAVYTDFLLQIMDHVIQVHGKQPQFWGDILLSHPDQIHRLPREAVALEWGYEASHPFAEDAQRFADAGLGFQICPGTSSWRSFAGRTDNMTANLTAAGQHAQAQGAQGLLLTDWGDFGHLQLEEVSALPLAFCALQAWNPQTARLEEAMRWCDQVCFENRQGDAAAWAAAGRVDDLLNWKPFNSNAFFNLFENPERSQQEIQGLGHAALQAALEGVDSLRPPRSQPEAWEQTLRNLRLSLLRELDRRQKTQTASALETEAMEAHAQLWRKRNHEGGLAESLSMYTNTRNP